MSLTSSRLPAEVARYGSESPRTASVDAGRGFATSDARRVAFAALPIILQILDDDTKAPKKELGRFALS